jgi:hypothetical protein
MLNSYETLCLRQTPVKTLLGGYLILFGALLHNHTNPTHETLTKTERRPNAFKPFSHPFLNKSETLTQAS